jgi:hypothetical protein
VGGNSGAIENRALYYLRLVADDVPDENHGTWPALGHPLISSFFLSFFKNIIVTCAFPELNISPSIFLLLPLSVN